MVGQAESVANHARLRRGAAVERRRRFSLRRLATAVVQQAALIAVSLVMIAPIYFVVVTAFKTNRETSRSPWSLPEIPTLEAFHTAFERGDLLLWFRNTVIVASGSVLVVTVLALLTAYALHGMRFPGRSLLRQMFIVLMMIPPIILVIPLFVLFARIGLVNSFLGASIVFCGLLIPFSVFLFVSFFDALPHEIIEAATLDGAGRFAILWQIVVPLALPAVVTQLLVNLLFVWNELLVVLIFLQSDERKTLAAGITVFQGRFLRDTPLVMAASLIVAVPMVLIYLAGQRAFLRGLTAGSLK
jgi:ABC-type glycerol-3-phosphate transport system permease component